MVGPQGGRYQTRNPTTDASCGKQSQEIPSRARSVIEEYADVCPTTSRGAARGPKKAPDSVRPGSAGRQLGKTFYMAVRGGEVTAVAGSAVGKHPGRISTSRISFALFTLCQPGRAGEAETELTARRDCGGRCGPPCHFEALPTSPRSMTSRFRQLAVLDGHIWCG